MTGYGRGAAEGPGGDGAALRVTVEVKAVNHRFLDVRVAGPRGMLALEGEVVAAVKRRVGRGRVEVHVRVDRLGEPRGVAADLDAARAVVRALHEVASAVSLPRIGTVADLVPLADRFLRGDEGPDPEHLHAPLHAALAVALDALDATRRAEGAAVAADLHALADALAAAADGIAARLPALPFEAQHRLRDRVARLLEGTGGAVDAGRLEQEIALLADRSDVHEELQRLRHHVASLRALAADRSPDPSGRRLDFLGQELGREANTLGSKVADPAVADLVMAMKAAVERIREQAQNIE